MTASLDQRAAGAPDSRRCRRTANRWRRRSRARAQRRFHRASDARHRRHLRIERRLVDGDHRGAETGQHPGPAARRGAEIEAAFARCRPATEADQRFPQLQIGAVGRAGPVLDKGHLAVGEGRAACAAASTGSGDNKVHEPSGAAGAFAGNITGLAETCGRRSWTSAARRWCSGAYIAQLRWMSRSVLAALRIESTGSSRQSCQTLAAQAVATAAPSHTNRRS